MEFKTDMQKQVYEKLQGWVKELFGAFARQREDLPAFGIMVGSAYVLVNVVPWGDDDATITTRSYVAFGTELTAELMHYLLRENDRMRFGAFGMDNEGDIFFQHTIVGSTCDKEELRASVMAVVYTADEYDDKIIQKWGGQRAIDRMNK